VIKTILTIVILVPGAFVTFYGLYKTVLHRRNRRVFVMGYKGELR